ncbi:nicotinate-nucleotide--dimethylbenzimidazole phosphoribosyltransferase [Marinivivus vitaminiproducens]|uniref:nicotinate-nucleotide--dimethylbenzimidazole phosphoribosyltransferase n=1 Tax=Marinivivus vitaminiproducens TaxID=3035935 RepID=UPI00279FBB21|nr:nicotinate-nucleotide--dimethylbenzimidazole phosphoribosyltransferase [Geminicoccaceae bacterium SCSIO 64248]
MTHPPSITTLAEMHDLARGLPIADDEAEQAVVRHDAQLTKPPGALGRLEDLTRWLAAWQGRNPPRLDRVLTVIFAGNHGVTAQGVSAFPAEVTAQMVANFQAGGAAINQLCRIAGSTLSVHPIALDRPTGDITREVAMDEAECVAALRTGMDAVEDGTDLLLIGEMGIGNTTAAAALAAALFGGSGADWAGPGTGLDAGGIERKAAAVDRALARHAPGLGDPVQALRRLGGRELAAMTGAILAARLRRVPVLLDGFVTTAAASVLHALDPRALAHCRAAHVSAEPGHRRLLAILGLDPLLDLGMRLGEASGAAVALPLLRAAIACHTGMATFDQAGVGTRA